MGRIAWGVLFLLLAGTLGTFERPALAEDDSSKQFNVDFSVGWDGCYRPGEWTPVDIGIVSNLKDPMGGALTLAADQDTMARMTITHPIVLTSKVRLHVPLVTKLTFGANSADVSIRDDQGKTRWAYSYDLWSPTNNAKSVQAVQSNEMLIGVVGRMSFHLGQLSDFAATAENPAGQVWVKDKQPSSLPWDWTGYAALDLLILNNPDWDAISPVQMEAMGQWVTNGGKLLIVVGSTGLPANDPFIQSLPVRMGLRKTVTVTSLNSGSGHGMVRCNARDVLVHEMSLLPEIGWSTDAAAPAKLAAGPVGFGRVGILAMDPSPLTDIGQADSAAIWTLWIRLTMSDSPRTIQHFPGGYNHDNSNNYSSHADPTESDTNKVLGELLSIRELKPLSIWWVIGLLGLLAVLLGPIDYLLLKKLDRLPLTWITSAGVIALFTVGAYYGVQSLRAGSMQVQAITLVDGIQGGPVWSTGYAGIFAPSSDVYQFTDITGKEWWSAISPSEGDNHYRHNSGPLANRQLFCFQNDGRNIPISTPINIWSMQCMVKESPAKMPMKAEIKTKNGKSEIHVTNTSKYALVDISAVYNGRNYSIRHLKSGETMMLNEDSVPHAPPTPQAHNMPPSDDGEMSPDESPDFIGRYDSALSKAYGCQKRSIAIQDYIAKGAVVITAYMTPTENPPIDFAVADKEYKVYHTMVFRLVVSSAKEISHD